MRAQGLGSLSHLPYLTFDVAFAGHARALLRLPISCVGWRLMHTTGKRGLVPNREGATQLSF